MGIRDSGIIKRWIDIMPTFGIAVGMMVFTIYMFYPGVINADSASQLSQAHLFKFADWHPPIMSFLWFILNHIYDGIPSMFIFHNLVFWGAAFLLALWLAPRSNWLRILFLLFFGFFPTILGQLGMVFKDTAMAVSLFLSSVLLLYAESSRATTRRLVIIAVALIFLFYGFSVRLNSAPAVALLCIWLVEIVFRKKVWLSVLLGSGLVILFFGGTQIITGKFLHPVKTYPLQQVQVHDLAGISLVKNKTLMPNYILSHKNFDLRRLQKDYNSMNVYELIFGHTCIINLTCDPRNISELDDIWWHSVLHHPLAYLKHRSLVFANLLIGCFAFTDDICRFPLTNFDYHPGFIYKLYCRLTFLGPLHFLFHSWVYIINSLIVAAVTIYFRRQFPNFNAIIYIVFSGLLYILGLFFSAPACEFRYIYWEVMASLLGVSLLVKNIFLKKSDNG